MLPWLNVIFFELETKSRRKQVGEEKSGDLGNFGATCRLPSGMH
jgi:hypothetical protein